MKVRLVKAVVFPVVKYGCESWTTKKAECWRIYAFELWCWRRLLRVPWTASLKVGQKGDCRGWDGWMASPTWETWVWASSRSWCWTGKPGVLQSMRSQRVGHGWVTELNLWMTPGLQMFISARRKLKGYKRTSPWPMVIGSPETSLERKENRNKIYYF